MVSREASQFQLPEHSASEPVLVLTPTGRDAKVAAGCLHEAGIQTQICNSVDEFCASLYIAAAGLIAEEALPAYAMDMLIPTLNRQPIWSNFPLIILTSDAKTNETMWQFVQMLGSAGNVTLLQRPLNRVTFLSTVRVALRSRRHQHEIRQLNEELQRRITEQASTLDQLHKSERRFRDMADTAPAMLWMSDVERRFTFLSQGWYDFTGHTEESGRDFWWTDVMHPDDRDNARNIFVAAAQQRKAFVLDYRMRRADGIYRWVIDTGRPRLSKAGHLFGYTGSVIDITERKQAEEALRMLNTTLEQRVVERTANLRQAHDELRHEMTERQRMQEALFQREKLAALGTLLANVAHELNNPLAVATMQLDSLEEAWASRPWPEDLEVLRQAVERCTSVVQSFLALARQQAPMRKAVALNAVIGDVLVLLEHSLEVDGIQVHLHLAEDLPSLWADSHQLHHVVTNLITNAHQALRQTAPPRYLTLTTAANAERTEATMDVVDTGPGIPKDLQRRIFEPFFTTKAQQGGSGLGLPLCRSIVEGHGGSLSINSHPGEGTTVHVVLSAIVPEASASEMSPEPVTPPQVSGKAILLIDDEPGVQRALGRLLQRNGHEVTTAANGYEGLTALQAHAYEVILCDMRMPDLDGPGFYHELKRLYPHLLTRVIFVTGDELSPEAQAFFDQVDCPRLVKPFRASEVRYAIQQMLAAQ